MLAADVDTRLLVDERAEVCFFVHCPAFEVDLAGVMLVEAGLRVVVDEAWDITGAATVAPAFPK